eukprot:TRINITY_DN17617_c0_g1_i1.p1 TRINITY_DN17617_c0_g1~~TRINITY_DN17617_c0_g1_i1.p1  ORF type:complete len:1053 (+),score=145.99 TRINITY_DN17617_c0_g1_i1:42-3161(+)
MSNWKRTRIVAAEDGDGIELDTRTGKLQLKRFILLKKPRVMHRTQLLMTGGEEGGYLVTLGGNRCDTTKSNSDRLAAPTNETYLVRDIIVHSLNDPKEARCKQLPFAVCAHSAAVMDDSRIALIGGLGANGILRVFLVMKLEIEPSLSIEHEFVSQPNDRHPIPRMQHTSNTVSIDSRSLIVVYGGLGPSQSPKDVRLRDSGLYCISCTEFFDVSTCLHVDYHIGSMEPPPRISHASTSLPHKGIAVYGGMGPSEEVLDDLWILEASSGSELKTLSFAWRRVLIHGIPRRMTHSLTMLNRTTLLVIGGHDNINLAPSEEGNMVIELRLDTCDSVVLMKAPGAALGYHSTCFHQGTVAVWGGVAGMDSAAAKLKDCFPATKFIFIDGDALRRTAVVSSAIVGSIIVCFSALESPPDITKPPDVFLGSPGCLSGELSAKLKHFGGLSAQKIRTHALAGLSQAAETLSPLIHHAGGIMQAQLLSPADAPNGKTVVPVEEPTITIRELPSDDLSLNYSTATATTTSSGGSGSLAVGLRTPSPKKSMPSYDIRLKVSANGETVLVVFHTEDGWEVFLDTLAKHTETLLPRVKGSVFKQGVTIKWVDDDGDELLLMSEAHFESFIKHYEGHPGTTRKIIVTENPIETGSRTPPSSAGKMEKMEPKPQKEVALDDENISDLKWTRGKLLGRGTYGTVYAALDQSGRTYAVKKIFVNDQDARTAVQMQSEIEMLKQLDHPNIVKLQGTYRGPDYVYIIMEYMAGGSVAAMARTYGGTNRGLETTIVQGFTRQILAGLSYLHSNNIIHRDIKGDNIFCDDRGGVKLGDFGASKFLVEPSSMAKSGLKGTVLFFAPEVIKEGLYSYSSDMWALGCTMIEMLTGALPWVQRMMEKGETNHMALAMWIASAKEIPPIPEGLPPSCSGFMKSCFKFNPRERPSAEDLLDHGFLSEVFEVEHTCAEPESEMGDPGDFMTLNLTAPSLSPSSVRTRTPDSRTSPSKQSTRPPRPGSRLMSFTPPRLDILTDIYRVAVAAALTSSAYTAITHTLL